MRGRAMWRRTRVGRDDDDSDGTGEASGRRCDVLLRAGVTAAVHSYS
jgi:hypothetical protein